MFENEGEKNTFNVPSWILQRCTIISNFGEPSHWIWKCMFRAILLIKWNKWQCYVSERKYVHLVFKGLIVSLLIKGVILTTCEAVSLLFIPVFDMWRGCVRNAWPSHVCRSNSFPEHEEFLGISLSRFTLRMHSIRHQIGSWTINRSWEKKSSSVKCGSQWECLSLKRV